MKKLLLLLLISFCTLTFGAATGFGDLKFSGSQIADTQWNVGSCINASSSGCQIYSKAPGPTWNAGYPVYPSATQYIAFTASGNASYPWHMYLYNSNGSVAQDLGIGKIMSQGAASDGHHYFFFSNANYNGTLFSIDWGMNNSNGLTITGTMMPTVPQTDQFAVSYGSTAPLTSGQSYSAAPAGPTVTGGTITQTNAPTSQTITSGGSSTAGITQSQQTRVNAWTAKTVTNNTIYIDQVGDNNTVSIVQTGNANLIKGIGQQAAQIQGNQNSITLNQGVSGTGQNEIDLRVVGSSNTVNAGQARDATGTAVGGNGHYQSLDVYGSSNTVTTQQSNAGGIGGHFMETSISGNSNIITNKQLDNGNKLMFATVNGNNNTATATQQGTGQHYLEYKLTGNNNSASVTQSGTTQNKASIDLTNAGGPASINLTQGGGMNFSIIQSCGIVGGCTTTVSQP